MKKLKVAKPIKDIEYFLKYKVLDNNSAININLELRQHCKKLMYDLKSIRKFA